MKGRKVSGLLLTLLLAGALALGSNLARGTEPPEIEWSRTYGGTGFDHLTALVYTSDGGYILTGILAEQDVFLIKTNSTGHVEWSQTYEGAGLEWSFSMVQANDGGYAMTGIIEPYGAYTVNVLLIKTDSMGNHQWNKTYARSDTDGGRSIVQTSDGGYAITGWTESDAGDLDFWLIKTDSMGNAQWNKTYGGTDRDRGMALIQASDGGYTMIGWTNSFGAGDYDFWLIETDSAGNAQWNKTYGGVGLDRGRSVLQTSDGGYAIMGETGSYGAGGEDFWLIKTDSMGNPQWNKTFGGADTDWPVSMVQTSDGRYAITGLTRSYGAGDVDAWLIETDVDGTLNWNQTWGGPDYDNAYSVVQRNDGGYTIGGATESFGAGGPDAYLAKFKPVPHTETHNVTSDGEPYQVSILTNSTITNFQFNDLMNEISFNVTGDSGTTGFCNMTVPKELGVISEVLVDGVPVSYTQTENATHYFLYFSYQHSTHAITITMTRSPSQLIEELVEDIKQMNLKQGISNSLDAKLNAALASLEALNANKRSDAINKLEAMINETEAQREKMLADEQADYIISKILNIIALING